MSGLLREEMDAHRARRVAMQEAQAAALRAQMDEKKQMAARAQAAHDAYEARKREEIENYNPFGRAGGGAPVRDAEGNTYADIRFNRLPSPPVAPAETKQWPAAGPSAAEPGPVVVASRPDLLAQVFPPADEYGAPPYMPPPPQQQHYAPQYAPPPPPQQQQHYSPAAAPALGARGAQYVLQRSPARQLDYEGHGAAPQMPPGGPPLRIHADLPAEAIDDVAVLPSLASIVTMPVSMRSPLDAPPPAYSYGGAALRGMQSGAPAAPPPPEPEPMAKPQVAFGRGSTNAARQRPAREPRAPREGRRAASATNATMASRQRQQPPPGAGMAYREDNTGAARRVRASSGAPSAAGGTAAAARPRSWPPSAAAAAVTAASAARQAWAARSRRELELEAVLQQRDDQLRQIMGQLDASQQLPCALPTRRPGLRRARRGSSRRRSSVRE